MLQVRTEPSRIPSLWLPLVVCVLVAILIDLGTLHRGQHADSLILIQMSLYRWTPFYWELDRVGSLVPGLAQPFKNPLTNLLVQEALYVWFTLAALVLLARYVVRDAAYLPVAFVSAAIFITLTPSYYRSEIFFSTYGVWLVFSLTALLLAVPLDGRQRWPRLALAVVMMIIAHWAYCTATVFLGPLVVIRSWLTAPDPVPVDLAGSDPTEASLFRRLLLLGQRVATPELRASLMLLAIGSATGFVLRSLLAPPAATDFGTLPLDQWPVAFRGLLANTWQNVAPSYGPLCLAGLAGSGALLLALPAVRRQTAPALKAAGALAAAALIIACFMATRKWVQLNQYMFRYLVPSVLYFQAALVILGVVPWLATLRLVHRTRAQFAAASSVLVLAAVYSYGLPSLAGVRNDVAEHHIPAITGINTFTGIQPEDVIDAHCTHVAGNYWKVWPAVFNANLRLYELGEQRVVWGITLRDKPTRGLWSRVPLRDLCVAVPAGGDPEADRYLREAGFPPLEVVERRPTAWILRPRELLPPGSDPIQESGPTNDWTARAKGELAR